MSVRCDVPLPGLTILDLEDFYPGTEGRAGSQYLQHLLLKLFYCHIIFIIPNCYLMLTKTLRRDLNVNVIIKT